MASEADFSDPVVTERAVEVTFRPTGDRLSFARFGTLLSPARPISPPHFGPHKSWEVQWLARNLAQQALLRDGGLAADDRRRVEARRRIEVTRGGDAHAPALAADAPTHVRLLQDLALAVTRGRGCRWMTSRSTIAADARDRRAGSAAALEPSGARYDRAGGIHPAGRRVRRDRRDRALGAGSCAGRGGHLGAAWCVAVNLSPAQFRQADLVEMIHADLVRHQLPGHRLELELTEGVLIDDTSRALSVLRALKQLGVAIALDDFGTGYSNLTYLRVLPIDRIKIDQSFVQDLGTSPQVDAIVRAIIGIGQALGLEVTAEGVETEAQLEFLRVHGCAQVQGFLFGQPSSGPLDGPAPATGSSPSP